MTDFSDEDRIVMEALIERAEWVKPESSRKIRALCARLLAAYDTARTERDAAVSLAELERWREAVRWHADTRIVPAGVRHWTVYDADMSLMTASTLTLSLPESIALRASLSGAGD